MVTVYDAIILLSPALFIAAGGIAVMLRKPDTRNLPPGNRAKRFLHCFVLSVKEWNQTVRSAGHGPRWTHNFLYSFFIGMLLVALMHAGSVRGVGTQTVLTLEPSAFLLAQFAGPQLLAAYAALVFGTATFFWLVIYYILPPIIDMVMITVRVFRIMREG